MFTTSTKIAAMTALTMVAILLAGSGFAQAQQAAPAAPAANAAPGPAAAAPAVQQPNPAIGQLLNQIQFASNEDARESAAKELAKINDPRTLLVLIQAAVYDSEDSVRQAARSAALKVSNGTAPRQAVEIAGGPVGTLMTQVLDGKEVDQRRQSAKDLGRSTDAHALAALEIAAVFDRDDAVRDAARKSAVQIWQSLSLADPASGSTAGPSTAVATNGPAPAAAPAAPALPAWGPAGQPAEAIAKPAPPPANPAMPVAPAPAVQPAMPAAVPQVTYPPTTTNPPINLQPAVEPPAAPAVPVTPVAPVPPVAVTPAVPSAPTTPSAPVVPDTPSNALVNVPQAQVPPPAQAQEPSMPPPPPTASAPYPQQFAPPAGYPPAPNYAVPGPVAPVVAAPPPSTVVIVRRGPTYYYYNPATGCYYAYPPTYYYPPAVVYSPAPPQFSLGVNLGFVFGHFRRH
jgi:hypothetical protein